MRLQRRSPRRRPWHPLFDVGRVLMHADRRATDHLQVAVIHATRGLGFLSEGLPRCRTQTSQDVLGSVSLSAGNCARTFPTFPTFPPSLGTTGKVGNVLHHSVRLNGLFRPILETQRARARHPGTPAQWPLGNPAVPAQQLRAKPPRGRTISDVEAWRSRSDTRASPASDFDWSLRHCCRTSRVACRGPMTGVERDVLTAADRHAQAEQRRTQNAAVIHKRARARARR
jgi:hypothetical protein